MPDSIYYNADLKPIPVNLVSKGINRAIVELHGKHHTVPANRVIPFSAGVRGCDRIKSRKPPGYLSISEYCDWHGIAFKGKPASLNKKCGWECRKSGLKSWTGKRDVKYYPASIIAAVLARSSRG